MDDTISHQVALGMATTYALEFLKRSKWFPWLTQSTATLNRVISIIVAFLSSVGIEAAIQGHLSFETGATLTLTIPSLSVIFNTIIHTVGQFGIQQATYQGLVKKPQPTMSLNTTTGETSVNLPAGNPALLKP